MLLEKSDIVGIAGVCLLIYSGTMLHPAIAPAVLGLACCWHNVNQKLFVPKPSENPEEQDV